MTVWNDLRTYEEYVPLGTFWSLDWDSPDDSLEATVTARDRRLNQHQQIRQLEGE